MVLEGGYNPVATAACIHHSIDALLGNPSLSPAAPISWLGGDMLEGEGEEEAGEGSKSDEVESSPPPKLNEKVKQETIVMVDEVIKTQKRYWNFLS